MSNYVLDTSALLTLHYNEPGSQRVADILVAALTSASAAPSPGVRVFGSFITLMEVLYRVWKNEGEAAGRKAYAACQALTVTWMQSNPGLLELAASLKARHPMSLGDACIAATALQCQAVLLHKDPEFEPVPDLQHEPLPYK
jgi:predicted nucleic acid-binding protein